MTSQLPFSLGEDIARGNVDFDTDSFKMMLVTSTYTVSQSHSKRSDITNEVSGTGYSAGGLACVVTNVTRSSGVTSVNFADVVWTAPVNGFTGRRGVIYKSRGGASSADELVAFVDFGADVAANGTSYTVDLTSALTITVP
jgi:hypothetical protein